MVLAETGGGPEAAAVTPDDVGIGRLFWTIHEAVIVANLDSGRIVLWNPAAESLLGYSAEEARALPLEAIVPEPFRERHRAGMARVRTLGTGPLVTSAHGVELPALHRSGTEVAVELTLRLIEGAPAPARYVMAIVRDVSDRRAALDLLQRQVEEARARASLFSALHEVAVAAGGLLDPRTLARVVVDRARALLGGEAAGLYLWDESTRQLVPLHSSDPGLSVLEQPIHAGEDAAGRAVQLGASVAVEDYPGWEHASDLARGQGVRSMLAVPLRVHDRVIGALSVRYYHPRTFGDDDTVVLSLLAAQVAPAMESARLYRVAQDEVDRRDALLRVARQFASDTDPTHLLGSLMEEAVRAVRGDLGAVYRWDAGARVLIPVQSSLSTRLSPSRVLPGQGAVGTAAMTGRPCVVNDYLALEHPVPEQRAAGTRAAVGIPLLHEGRLLGVLGVSNLQEERRFTPADVETLELLAGLATATLGSLERARVEGALMLVRTAEHEIYNQLAAAGGFTQLVARDAALSDRQRVRLERALERIEAATTTVGTLGDLTRLVEKPWGSDVEPTIDLDRAKEPPAGA